MITVCQDSAPGALHTSVLDFPRHPSVIATIVIPILQVGKSDTERANNLLKASQIAGGTAGLSYEPALLPAVPCCLSRVTAR